MSRKHKKVCRTLNCIERFLCLASVVNGCISISPFASLLGIPVGITSAAIGLKICTVTTRIKKFKSLIEKRKKKRNKIAGA